MTEINDACADFENLDELLAEIGTDVGAAEFHGMTSGIIAGGMQLEDSLWLERMMQHIGVDEELDESSAETLKALYRLTLSQLANSGVEFTFQPVLPDDDFPIVDRLDALAQWCQGFLSGLGLLGNLANVEDPYLQESMGDLSAIAMLDPHSGDYGEEAENELFELIEFVRVACHTVFTECGLAHDNETHNGDEPKILH